MLDFYNKRLREHKNKHVVEAADWKNNMTNREGYTLISYGKALRFKKMNPLY